ncbi:MAG: SGNH/GDSL hydrolase family protein [Clostridia bacterium]|nr:SGNH/GDSL hydrolase family protein [Clostridia bacterium]
MKLDLAQIKSVTLGAVRIEQTEQGVFFYRFTKEQEELYKVRNKAYYARSFATSGVKLRFCTDSETLFLDADVIAAGGRTYFSFDVLVNGKMIGALDNYTGKELPVPYTEAVLERGEVSGKFNLGAGKKEVCIYLPWSNQIALKSVELDDNSFVEPVKFSKKILCFGDSITQGYDALCSSNKYITKFAEMLDAEEYNKAIGGEVFFPELAASKEDFEPDYITVAYGTNDWGMGKKEVFEVRCKAFFENLTNNYPNAKIIAITPIWRKEMYEVKRFGDFMSVAEIIEAQVKGFKNVSVVKGFGFVPKEESYYADLRLHPNDKGFAEYFESLAKSVKDIL